MCEFVVLYVWSCVWVFLFVDDVQLFVWSCVEGSEEERGMTKKTREKGERKKRARGKLENTSEREELISKGEANSRMMDIADKY